MPPDILAEAELLTSTKTALYRACKNSAAAPSTAKATPAGNQWLLAEQAGSEEPAEEEEDPVIVINL
ncbi:MAG: hypothetical protein H6643_13945 [Caldilineaceae bacterium]|nr:hypothetical protein [Caldilineaceae bacterium]